jgi:acyl dehydratase
MKVEQRFLEDYQVGEQRITMGRTITETDIVVHAGQTGDFFPHHMDAEWSARELGSGRIAHGTLIMSIAVGMTAADINPAAMSYGYDRVRFVAPVMIGDTITVTTRIESKRDHPRRNDTHGYLEELIKVVNHRAETVLVLTHLYLVKRRPPPEGSEGPARVAGPDQT